MASTTKRRPRIALVVSDYSQEGGLKSVAKFLQSILDESEYEYTIISLATSSSDSASTQLRKPWTWWRGPTLEKRNEAGQVYWHVGCHFAELEFMRYAPRMLLTALLQQFDLVQVIAGTPAWGVATLGVRRPVVVKTATLVLLERTTLLRDGRGMLALWRRVMTGITNLLDQVSLWQSNAIVVVNEQMIKRLERFKQKVHYIPSGVDTRFFTLPSDNTERKYLLSVGRFDDPRKNPALLFRAYRQLLDRLPTAPPLVLAGKTMPPPAAQALLDELGIRDKVVMRTDLTSVELLDLYRGALAFWLTSNEEGQGLVLVEAMACGVPVISTMCGGPESVIRDGIDGFLVALDDAEAFAVKTLELIDRWPNMSQASRERAENMYSLHVAGAEYVRLYDTLLGRA